VRRHDGSADEDSLVEMLLCNQKETLANVAETYEIRSDDDERKADEHGSEQETEEWVGFKYFGMLPRLP
jgi:hypothetical protein